MRLLQVRVMPNTPCLIREAASAYVLGNSATPLDASRTFALMRSVGMPTACHHGAHG